MLVNLGKRFFENEETFIYTEGISIFDYPSKFETGIRIEIERGHNTSRPTVILADYCNHDAILPLQVSDHLREIYPNHKQILYVPYLPYARMDRKMSKDAFTLKTFAKLINNQNFDSVYIADPHSAVATALIDRSKEVNLNGFYQFVIDSLIGTGCNHILIPDAGAAKKIQSNKLLSKHFETIQCGKKRDVNTGKLSQFEIYGDVSKHNAYLIVDDIIDGGGSFLGLADAVRQINPQARLYLAATHGIFSKGPLHHVFERTFITNTFDTHVGDIENYKTIIYDLVENTVKPLL